MPSYKDGEYVTLCYEEVDTKHSLEICVTGFGDTFDEAARQAEVNLERYKRLLNDD